MDEVKEVVQEIHDSDDSKLEEVISAWFEKTRTQSMKIGAQYISAAMIGLMKRHLNKPKVSLRDYKRCINEMCTLLSIQTSEEITNIQEN